MKTKDIPSIVHHYLHCALWTEELESFGLEKIHANSVTQALTDCNNFVEKAGSLLDSLTEEQIGHDFWLTRNGHGSGFLDRYLDYEDLKERENIKKIGKKLAIICNEFNELNVFAPDFSEHSIIIE